MGGTQFITLPAGTPSVELYGVFGFATAAVWVVGDRGVIARVM